MKKIIGILIMLLMVISIIPLAFAEETNETDIGDNETDDDIDDDIDNDIDDDIDDDIGDNETDDDVDDEDETDEEDEDDVDEETQGEVRAMISVYGAKMRLLQLEKSITRNILKGKEIIIIAQEAGKNTTELESIIDEMEALKEEVQAANPEAEDAVQVFVDLKKDAIELSKKFREAAKGLFSAEDAKKLRERLKEIHKDELRKLAEQIKQRMREYNAERLRDILERLGFENIDELIERVETAQAELDDVYDMIRDRLKEMTPEEKKEAFSDMKKANVNRAVIARAKVDKIRAKLLEREENRITKRLEKIEEKNNESLRAEALKKYAEKRLEDIEKIRSRIDARIEKAQEIREKIKNRKPTLTAVEETEDKNTETDTE